MISIWIKGRVRIFTFEQFAELLPRLPKNHQVFDVYNPGELSADDIIRFPSHMTHAEELRETFARS